LAIEQNLKYGVSSTKTLPFPIYWGHWLPDDGHAAFSGGSSPTNADHAAHGARTVPVDATLRLSG
jgi:hypothetical protein